MPVVDVVDRASTSAVGTPAAAMISLANTFEPSSRAASRVGPKAAMPASLERVDEPGDQRRLGADDDEVDRLVARQRDEARDVVGRDVEQPRVGGDARVAGRAEQLGRAAASARSARTIACSRPPAPTTRTFTRRHRLAMKSSTGIAASVSSGPCRASRARARPRHRRLVGRLDDVDEVEAAERRPLRLDARAELLDLLVDLADPLRVVLDRLHALGRQLASA